MELLSESKTQILLNGIVVVNCLSQPFDEPNY